MLSRHAAGKGGISEEENVQFRGRVGVAFPFRSGEPARSCHGEELASRERDQRFQSTLAYETLAGGKIAGGTSKGELAGGGSGFDRRRPRKEFVRVHRRGADPDFIVQMGTSRPAAGTDGAENLTLPDFLTFDDIYAREVRVPSLVT